MIAPQAGQAICGESKTRGILSFFPVIEITNHVDVDIKRMQPHLTAKKL